MSVFVSDTFTEASNTALQAHTGETGAPWTQHGSYAQTMTVAAAVDRVRGGSIGGHLYYASGSPASAEYDVQADFVATATVNTSDKLGVAGRINTAADTFYRVEHNPGGAFAAMELFKKVAGTSTSLGSVGFGADWSASTTVTQKLAIRDATKKVYLGGVEKISSTDNAITAAGKAGVWMVLSSAAGDSVGEHVDNFSATDAASTVSLSRSLADTITIGDAVVRSSLAHSRALADSVTISDAVARVVAEARSLADTLTIGDALARSAVAQSRTAGDTLTITDAVDASSIASLTRDIADTVTIGDAVARAISLGRGVADSVTIGDALARSAISFIRAIADTITITDSLSRQVSTTAQVRTVTRYSATTRPVGQHGAGTRAVGQHRSGVNP